MIACEVPHSLPRTFPLYCLQTEPDPRISDSIQHYERKSGLLEVGIERLRGGLERMERMEDELDIGRRKMVEKKGEIRRLRWRIEVLEGKRGGEKRKGKGFKGWLWMIWRRKDSKEGGEEGGMDV